MLRTEGSTLGGVPADVHDNGHTAALVYDLATVEDPLEWVTAHREPLRAALRSSGFVLLRGAAGDVGAFHEVVSAVGGDLLEYTERSTPRSAVSGNIYTSTEYPADQAIPMHNENSYASRWPQLLFFSCQTPPATGGATPIADSRSVLALLPADLRARFADGVVYTRTYRDGLGLSWEEAFQTADRGAVEQYCTRHGIEFEWVEDGLRTRHRRPPPPGPRTRVRRSGSTRPTCSTSRAWSPRCARPCSGCTRRPTCPATPTSRTAVRSPMRT